MKYLKGSKIAFRCRSLVYKGIYFNIKKYRYNTSCESQKTYQSELFCFPWEQTKNKNIGSEKGDAILHVAYNQAFDLLPTFSSEEKANKNKA